MVENDCLLRQSRTSRCGIFGLKWREVEFQAKRNHASARLRFVPCVGPSNSANSPGWEKQLATRHVPERHLLTQHLCRNSAVPCSGPPLGGGIVLAETQGENARLTKHGDLATVQSITPSRAILQFLDITLSIGILLVHPSRRLDRRIRQP